VRRLGKLPRPRRRARSDTGTVAKLIDTDQGIGCKACQVACMEWNDLRDEIGKQRRRLRQPERSVRRVLDVDGASPNTRTPGDLEWLIRRTAACTAPTGVPEGLPGAGGGRGSTCSTRTASWTFTKRTASACGYCITGCPFQHPAHLQARITRPTNEPCAPTAWRLGLERPASKPVPPVRWCSGPRRTCSSMRERVEDLKSRGFDQAGLYDPPAWGART